MTSSSLLTDCELASLTDLVSSGALFGGVCDILRRTDASDGQGGTHAAWAPVQTGVSCNLEPLGTFGGGATESLAAETVLSTERWILTLPLGTDITEKDRVVMGGQTFEVKGVREPVAPPDLVIAVLTTVR